MALASTVYLDPSYMAFLQSASGHRHERVAAVARAMLDSLQTSIAAGEDVLGASPLSQADRRLEAIAAISGQGEGSYFGLRQDCFPTLTLAKKHAPRRPQDPNDEACQKMNSVPVQNLSSDSVRVYGHTLPENGEARLRLMAAVAAQVISPAINRGIL
ncbi:MAG: hypothetical protein ACREXU_11720 [Gammaproteobacteria bacterium]